MKLIHIIVLASLLALSSGCGIIKKVKYIKAGTVSRDAFKTEVPFEMRLGLIVLKVMIHGKEHSFILDSGAPDAISKDLAQELGVTTAGSGKVHDSQGASGSLGFTAIDSIGIGDIQFLNTGALIADLHQSTELPCFKAEGLIGANLMRKAIWQIDYDRHIITITSSRDSLAIPFGAPGVKFHTDVVGVPFIDVQLSGHTDHNITVDLGSNADFISSTKTLQTLQENGLRTNTYSYGATTSGVYGWGAADTTWYPIVPTLQLGSLSLSNEVVSFIPKGTKSVGTNFFKNYRIILDWSAHQLTMIPVHPYDNTSHKEYNFSLHLKDQKVFIGSIYAAKDAAPNGPQLGDQVLEIDGQDYRSCTQDQWCTILYQRFDNSISGTTIRVKRGDKELSFTVAKEALFLKR